MKKQFFAFGLALAMMSNAMAFNERSMFDETNETSNWTFIENQFITKPAAEKATLWAHISSGVAIAAVLTSFGTFFTLTQEQSEAKLSTDAFTKGNMCLGVGTLSAGVALTSYLNCCISTRVNRNAVANFFDNYEQNQFFVPSELENAFDLIAETMEFEGRDAILNNANEIVDMIQNLVMRNFEKRYEKVLQGAASSALNDSKTATDICKNLVECAAKIAGSK